MTLYEQFKDFEKNYSRGVTKEEDLNKRFYELAHTLLYGGYLDFYGECKVYPRTVEFYFHEEGGLITDPIVYHKNRIKPTEIKYEYFPMLSLHAHISGFDIAFESSEGRYRASALIRKFSVKDSSGKFVLFSEKLSKECGKYEDNHSTHIYDWFNGLPLSGGKVVSWVDEPVGGSQRINIDEDGRVNVYTYRRSNPDAVPKENTDWVKNGTSMEFKDKRPWSFTAVDLIPEMPE